VQVGPEEIRMVAYAALVGGPLTVVHQAPAPLPPRAFGRAGVRAMGCHARAQV
jgi:hypothetical protein